MAKVIGYIKNLKQTRMPFEHIKVVRKGKRWDALSKQEKIAERNKRFEEPLTFSLGSVFKSQGIEVTGR